MRRQHLGLCARPPGTPISALAALTRRPVTRGLPGQARAGWSAAGTRCVCAERQVGVAAGRDPVSELEPASHICARSPE